MHIVNSLHLNARDMQRLRVVLLGNQHAQQPCLTRGLHLLRYAANRLHFPLHGNFTSDRYRAVHWRIGQR